MSLKQVVSKSLKGLRVGFVVLTVFQFSLGGPLVGTLQAQGNEVTRTPIRHVIVIVGENRSFDHVFATYKPKHGQHVDNLLSKKIINEDGTPGPEFSVAAQYSADITGDTEFQLSPRNKTPYSTLPSTAVRRMSARVMESVLLPTQKLPRTASQTPRTMAT
jgi:tRNA A37 threonylcarbamoyladenosine modification protein TsaB